MTGKRLRRNVRPNPRLVIVKLVALAAIKHLDAALAPCMRAFEQGKLSRSQQLEPTYPENLQDVAVRLITAKLITGAVET